MREKLKHLLKRRLCCNKTFSIFYQAKGRYKFTKTKLVFDIYQSLICDRCGKVIDKIKVKSNLNQNQKILFMNNLKRFQ